MENEVRIIKDCKHLDVDFKDFKKIIELRKEMVKSENAVDRLGVILEGFLESYEEEVYLLSKSVFGEENNNALNKQIYFSESPLNTDNMLVFECVETSNVGGVTKTKRIMELKNIAEAWQLLKEGARLSPWEWKKIKIITSFISSLI